MNKVAVLNFRLNEHSEESFIKALDEAGLSHGRVMCFSTNSKQSSVVESISSISDAMPWNIIAKGLVKWLRLEKVEN